MNRKEDEDLKKKDPAGHLYLLTWLDCLERLDVLLLESRHLQQNIIHALRAPVLYLRLRKEEGFLWGSDFTKWIYNIDADEIPRIFVDKNIQPYPDPKKLLTEKALDDSDPDEKDLKVTLARLWHHGGWGRDQRRHYHSLCALQLVKRQILVDKIHLCRQARAAKLAEPQFSSKEPRESYARPKFLILRSAIMARMRRYIERLRDHQHQFNQVLDAGLQDHPRPIIERRRELGIYMDFLADRSRDLQRDMDHLLADLKHNRSTESALIIHRWAHSYTSSNSIFIDEVGDKKVNVDYVNSHYWMPERPDLQPVLAHEVAHGILRRRFEDLSDSILANGEDPFTELVVLLHHAYYEFGNQYPDSRLAHNVIKEMVCDLLAASVKGYCYLYSLFLEIIGIGVEVLLQGAADVEHDLDIINSLSTSMGGENIGLWRRSWYYRLRLIVAWLRRVQHWYPSALDSLLLDGVDQVAGELLGFIDSITVPWYRRASVDQALLARIIELVNDSPAASGVKAWRLKRSQDDVDEQGNLGPGEMPRSMRRLDWRTRDFLYRVHLDMKRQKHRPLFGCNNLSSAQKKFEDVYGVSHKLGDPSGWNNDNHLPRPGWPRSPLYRHLYDIPWQCSLTRAIDIFYLKKDNNISDSDVIMQFHHDAALGRELFTVAMEFYLWETSSPYHRLVYITGLIEKFLNKYKISKDLFETLLHWIGHRDGGQPQEEQLNSLINTLLLNNLDRKNKDGYQDAAKFFDANLISLACVTEKVHRNPDPAIHRRAERLAGYKLSELRKILENNLELSPELEKQRLLYPLFEALNISNPLPNAEHKNNFYTRIIDAINMSANTSGKPSFGSLRSFLIRRISIAGSHVTTNNHSGSALQSNVNANYSDRVIPLADFIKKPKWSCTYSTNPHSSNAYFYQTLLGRYDILALYETKPICRDDLSFFDHFDLRCSRDTEKATGNKREHFPSFFTRPEMATAVRLPNVPWNLDLSNQDPMTGIVALCAVVLHRRALRLDFLYRVLTAIQLPHPDGSCDGKCIDSYQFGQKLEQDACAFLTDGWADLLFVFTGALSAQKLQDIFDIQNTFYQDFMVERTELILTPQCVPFALSKEGFESGFQVGLQARLKEERSLSPINDEFAKSAEIIIMHGDFQAAFGNSKVKIRRMPGRMDFDLELIYDENCNTINEPKDESTIEQRLKQLARLYDIDCVDRISTHIKIQQPQNNSSFKNNDKGS